jgi:hypothetical protein
MLSTAPRRPRAQGFSSMEVLAGLTLTLILLAAVYSFQQAQMKAYSQQQVYSDSQNVTRSVIDLMARELRMACYDPGTAIPTVPKGAACAPGNKQGIIEATPARIHFQQDLNGDNVIGAAGEDVTYDLSNGSIIRTDGAAPPVVLASGVPTGGLSFLYFDINGNQIVPGGSPAVLNQCQRDSVTRVRMTVRANLPNPNARVSTPIASVAQSEVAVRNRTLIANF